MLLNIGTEEKPSLIHIHISYEPIDARTSVIVHRHEENGCTEQTGYETCTSDNIWAGSVSCFVHKKKLVDRFVKTEGRRLALEQALDRAAEDFIGYNGLSRRERTLVWDEFFSRCKIHNNDIRFKPKKKENA